MSIIIICHNLANVDTFCSSTVPTRDNAFQSTCMARTFRGKFTWAFDEVLQLHLITFKMSLVVGGSSVIVGTYLSFSSFQPQSSGFRTSEFKLFHS